MEEAISVDFRILNFVAKCLHVVPALQDLQIPETVEQFRVHMGQQVDLQREADNLDRFRAGFVSWRDVSFPAPLPGLVTSEVLVETYEEGVGIAGFLTARTKDHSVEAPAKNEEKSTSAGERSTSTVTAKGMKETDKTGDVSSTHAAAVATTAVAEHDLAAAAADDADDDEDLHEEDDDLGLLPGDTAYLAGTSLAARTSPAVRREIASLGVHALLKMLLEDNWLHADLHPGNFIYLFI